MIGTVDERARALLDVSISGKVIANEGRFPLLGTGLLEQRVLHIDYAKKQLSLD
ncbi:MAG TPA: hypothetical protein VMM76_23150 [Pirellulaceae bacterium]|nr:hypothetical protein [Pirellulaceae bacterium]